MTKVRATEWDEGVKTRYIQESTQNDGYTASRDMRRVASVPPIILQLWTKEYNGSNNWWALPKEIQKKIMRVKLNSSEFRYFRTSEGSL